MTNTKWSVWGVALAAGLSAAAAHAELLTSPAQVGSSLVIGFDAPAGAGLTGPVDVGAGTGFAVNFSTTGGTGSVGIAPLGVWELRDNGLWGFDAATGGDKTFAAVDGDIGGDGSIASLVFDFAGLAVQKVGAFMNYDPGYVYGDPLALPLPLYIAAYGIDGNLLDGDSYELPVFTPGEINGGAFYGIGRPTADIAKFVVVGPYAVVDDLTFSAPVPEPGTWAMLGAGVLVLGAMTRRRKRTA
jgi:hypothetical protein